MATPQSALFIEETDIHYHAEFRLRPGLGDTQAGLGRVATAIGDARRAATWLGGPNVVWGIGADLWRALAPHAVPADIAAFAGVTGAAPTSAPATPGDIWLWCHGSDYHAAWRTQFDAARYLGAVADLQREVRAYREIDSRDPTGFIDGTENPLLDEAIEVALIPAGCPGAGGSIVLVQKWVHDLAAFEALSVSEQEGVFGRTRDASLQLPDDAMPATSHVSRNTIVDTHGDELHIYRRNTPFASLSETGTVFIGASRDPRRIDEMLQRMFGATPDGLYDRLTDFSAAVSGAYYFVPSMDDLTSVFGSLAVHETHTTDTPAPLGGISTGLGIGSLRNLG